MRIWTVCILLCSLLLGVGYAQRCEIRHDQAAQQQLRSALDALASHTALDASWNTAFHPDAAAVFQQQPNNPIANFKPDEPLDLSGPVPADDDVREAIKTAVNFVLSQQNSNGSWDVALSGQLLSQVADQAVDAVMVTSLCGIALRYHHHVDPVRIDAALEKATDFVIERILRGKLSTRIFYSIWRYHFGLRFLSLQYMAAKDKDRKEEIQTIAKRMVQVIMNLQLSADGAPVLEKARKAKLRKSNELYNQPAVMGIQVGAGDDPDSALITSVVPASAADKAGLEVGDVIKKLDGVKLYSHYDFYDAELRFVAGQEVSVSVQRGRSSKYIRVKLEPTWPGEVGVEVEQKGGTVVVKRVKADSAAAITGIEVGDAILKLDGTDIATVKEFEEEQDKLLSGVKVKILLLKNEKRKSTDITPFPRASGTLYLRMEEEDKTDLDGVIAAQQQFTDSPVTKAGVKPGDRIMQLDHIIIKGYDHFVELEKTLWAGKKVELKVLRGTQELKIPVTAMEPHVPGQMGISFKATNDPRIMIVQEVRKDSCAEKAGMLPEDRVVAFNGAKLQHIFHLQQLMGQTKAGQIVKVTVVRDAEEKTLEIELDGVKLGMEVKEEGGWNYYPMGVATSFVTAAVLMNLNEVRQSKRDGGMQIEVPEEIFEAGIKLLDSLRCVDKDHGDVEGYQYQQGTLETGGGDVRGQMGRNAVCELASIMLNPARTEEHLDAVLATWLKHRGELDKVRFFEHTHYRPLFNNAAYYWLFGHYFSAMAAKRLTKNDMLRERVNTVVLKAMMLTRRDDGTWMGHASFGKLIGTCEALMVFGELEGKFHEVK